MSADLDSDLDDSATSATEKLRTPFSHAKCGKRWSGLRTAHCSACCMTFTGLSAFDSHRVFDESHPSGRGCLTPREAGLELSSGRTSEVWGLPFDGKRWWDKSDADGEPNET